MESVRRVLRRGAVNICFGTAPCGDESRDRASANRAAELLVNGVDFKLKSLPLTW